MTGPEHYREAERLLEPQGRTVDGKPALPSSAHLAAAQVHATLALVSATAESVVQAVPSSPQDRRLQQAWSAAIS